jgi:hypothetical protein
MPGRRTKNVTNPQAHEAWLHRKRDQREGNSVEILRQHQWREDSLRDRAQRGKLTDKNRKEIERLEFKIA